MKVYLENKAHLHMGQLIPGLRGHDLRLGLYLYNATTITDQMYTIGHLKSIHGCLFWQFQAPQYWSWLNRTTEQEQNNSYQLIAKYVKSYEGLIRNEINLKLSSSQITAHLSSMRNINGQRDTHLDFSYTFVYF